MHFVKQGILGSLLLLALSGCASDGSFVNPFSSDSSSSSSSTADTSSSSTSTASAYYFADFSDLPVPKEMSEVNEDTVITYAPSGVKCGIQRFKGRVDASSLVNTMRSNMLAQGWTLRSLLRATHTMLVFDKADRVCSVYITDDLINTNMRIFMSPRLDGDHGNVDLAAYPSGSSKASSVTSKPLDN